MRLKISNLKIHITDRFENLNIRQILSNYIKVQLADIEDVQILKKSIDARKKPELFYILSLAFSINSKTGQRLINNKKLSITEYKENKYIFPCNTDFINIDVKRPVIVGFGPAGFICAYMLAKIGLKPIVIERGSQVEQRIKDVQEFWEGGPLNPNSNIQFGEGGAGTFSDGKLQTGVKDKYGRISFVLKILVENGAPNSILYESKPHIGTDILTEVVRNIRNKIIEFGGEIHFNALFTRCLHNNFMLTGAVIKENDIEKIIETDKLILCIGHSARDTFYSLFDCGLEMISKPFAVGFRVIHKQSVINKSQYGTDNMDYMPAADYKVTYQAASGRGVYSFCMCPGGYVVNASSEENMLAVNGMSYSKRDSIHANSAIIITVDSSLFGDQVFAGLEFQRDLERKTYEAGIGKIPVEFFDDFKNNKTSDFITNDELCIKGLYTFSNLRQILPDSLNEDIIEAFEDYGRVIQGFDMDVYFAGTETRTSSPVKIIRDDSYQSNIKGLYPCGEGAGYAGGITSAAVDGLKVAETVAMHYNSELGIL